MGGKKKTIQFHPPRFQPPMNRIREERSCFAHGGLVYFQLDGEKGR